MSADGKRGLIHAVAQIRHKSARLVKSGSIVANFNHALTEKGERCADTALLRRLSQHRKRKFRQKTWNSSGQVQDWVEEISESSKY